jgi:hypothetical protein
MVQQQIFCRSVIQTSQPFLNLQWAAAKGFPQRLVRPGHWILRGSSSRRNRSELKWDIRIYPDALRFCNDLQDMLCKLKGEKSW